MAGVSVENFSTWLSEKLLCINKDVDLDVFVDYITGILETDTSRDDKNESLEGIIGEILVRASVYFDPLTGLVGYFSLGNGHYPPGHYPPTLGHYPPAVYICLYLTKWSRGFQICGLHRPPNYSTVNVIRRMQ